MQAMRTAPPPPRPTKPAPALLSKSSIAALAFVALVVIGVLLLALLGWFYGAEGTHETTSRQRAHKQLAIHLEDVDFAISATSGSGLPWYEAMEVPAVCLDRIIVKDEIKHGLRPKHWGA